MDGWIEAVINTGGGSKHGTDIGVTRAGFGVTLRDDKCKAPTTTEAIQTRRMDGVKPTRFGQQVPRISLPTVPMEVPLAEGQDLTTRLNAPSDGEEERWEDRHGIRLVPVHHAAATVGKKRRREESGDTMSVGHSHPRQPATMPRCKFMSTAMEEGIKDW